MVSLWHYNFLEFKYLLKIKSKFNSFIETVYHSIISRTILKTKNVTSAIVKMLTGVHPYTW